VFFVPFCGHINIDGATVSLNVFVLVPFDRIKGEYLNGYRIGKYPQTPLKRLAVYKPPRGFIEVTRENAETLISPHFRLGQFRGGCVRAYVDIQWPQEIDEKEMSPAIIAIGKGLYNQHRSIILAIPVIRRRTLTGHPVRVFHGVSP
jgi:hypothetical protein